MGLSREALVTYLTERMGLDADVVEDDVPLFSSGLLDSFSMVDMIMFVEKEAGVRLSPTEVSLDNLDSIARIRAFVDAKTQ